jgi:hypothetical protein
MNYELVLASETFEDDNDGFEYGINWLDEDGEFIVDCEWFKTEEERQECLDKWYAEQNQFEAEQ